MNAENVKKMTLLYNKEDKELWDKVHPRIKAKIHHAIENGKYSIVYEDFMLDTDKAALTLLGYKITQNSSNLSVENPILERHTISWL